jgi:anaerobic magnesium-protoporphyrin IX monomethyl ester cyclase
MLGTLSAFLMKILILDHGRHRETVAIPHLGFGYVAAALEAAGYPVTYLDVNEPERRRGQIAIPQGHMMVCLSASTFSFLEAGEMAERIKKESPESLVVLGGPHTSLEPEKILENPHLDLLVVGEGEETIVEVARAVEEQGRFDTRMADEIGGIAFRHEGVVRRTPPRPWIEDLDRIPFPAFHLFPMHLYQQYPMITARGCPFDCVFCSSKTVWGRKWRARSPENIIQEIQHAIERFNLREKYFAVLDDTFNLDVGRAEAICDGIVEAGLKIRWINSGIRADRVPPSLAKKMRRAGCEVVGVGIESANRTVLENIKKGETLEELTLGIRTLQGAGIRVFGFFMIGNPGDTLETVRETIDYAKTMGLWGADFSMAVPYPGTQLWDIIERQGRFVKKDYYLFHNFRKRPLFETPEFSVTERKRAYRKATRFTFRLRITQGFTLGVRSFLEACRKDPLSVPRKIVRALRLLLRQRGR